MPIPFQMNHQYRRQFGYIKFLDRITFCLTIRTVPTVNFLATEIHVHTLIQITEISIGRQLQTEIREAFICGRLLVAGNTFHRTLDLAVK